MVGHPIRVLHVSDPHCVEDPGELTYGQNSDDNLGAAIEAVLQAAGSPDVIVATGDISDDSSPAAYDRVANRLWSAAAEAFWVPGNHDTPVLMNALAADGFPTARRLGGWRLVLLDSAWAGHSEGRLGWEQLQWLRAQLEGSEDPAVLVLHHPPVQVCSDPDCQLSDADAFLGVVADHPQARLVLSGHVHRPFERTIGEALFLGAPSTCRQIHHEAPRHAWTNEAPASRSVTLYPDGHFEHRLIPTAPPPAAPALEWWE